MSDMKEASVHLWYSWKWPWNNEIHRVNVWDESTKLRPADFIFLYIIVIICERYKIDVVHSFRTFLIKITNKSREYVWIGFWNNDSSNLSHVLARTQEKQIYKKLLVTRDAIYINVLSWEIDVVSYCKRKKKFVNLKDK